MMMVRLTAVMAVLLFASGAGAHDDGADDITETMTTTAQELLQTTRGDMTFSEALVGDSMEEALLEPEGLSAKGTDDQQRQVLQNLVHTVVSVYRPQIADTYLNEIELDDLSFAWIGSTEPGEPHYYRVQGSDFVFEFDNVQSGCNHIHQVWRSRSGYFGAELLKRHYEDEH